MKRILFLILLAPIFSNAQEKLNQLDSAKKRDGKWVLYYNKYMHVTDSASAAYCCYEFYYHGKQMHTHAAWGRKNWRLSDSTEHIKSIGTIKMLDGKYTMYTNKGQLSSVHYFKNGELIWNKDYYASGKLYFYWDYTEKCDDMPYTSHMHVYKRDGTLYGVFPITNKYGVK